MQIWLNSTNCTQQVFVEEIPLDRILLVDAFMAIARPVEVSDLRSVTWLHLPVGL